MEGLIGAEVMSRHHAWSFHNPRLSIAQSGMRAVISHSLTGEGGAGLMQSRVAAFSRGVLGSHVAAVPAVGICAGEPAVTALGTVLEQVDQGRIQNSGDACAAYLATRTAQAQAPLTASVSQPPQAAVPVAAPAAVPTAAGAGTVATGLGRECMDLVAQFLLAWVFRDQARQNADR